MKEFTVKTNYGSYDHCTYTKMRYSNNHVAVQLFCPDGPLARLTTNIPGIEQYPETCSCIDTNNYPWGEELVQELGLAEFTGAYLHSGYCAYPVYKFYL